MMLDEEIKCTKENEARKNRRKTARITPYSRLYIEQDDSRYACFEGLILTLPNTYPNWAKV